MHQHYIHIQENCRGHCNQCRITASTFMSTASSIKTYCMHIVGHYIHSIGTASMFRDTVVVSANTAATLHPAEVTLQVHCHHCRITAFTFIGTAYYNTPQCLHIV